MAQSSPWLSVGEAASRLHIGEHDVLELAVLGILPSQLVVNAREVRADAVARLDEQIRHASECAAQQGEVVAESTHRPIWTPWSSADDPEARDERADYDDTPNEEGDEN